MPLSGRFAPLGLLLLPAGCAAPECPPGFVQGAEECEFDQDAVLQLVRTMDAGALVKLNAEPYIPPYSSNPIERNVWVSPVPVPDWGIAATDLYLTIDQDDWSTPLEVEFPVGTVIIHEAVNREEPHGVEVKRDDYVDETGRPWWLRMVYDDGTIDETPREACADCHTESYRPTEGLWGVPTFAK